MADHISGTRKPRAPYGKGYADPAPSVEQITAQIEREITERVYVDAKRVVSQIVDMSAIQLDLRVAQSVSAAVVSASNNIEGLISTAIASALPVRHEVIVHRGDLSSVKLVGTPHKNLPDLIAVAGAGEDVMLVGPAGSGKTTAAMQLSKALGVTYYEQSCNPMMSTWDLLGYRSPDGKYIPGAMRYPYEHGGVWMLDEIDNSNPSIMVALNSAISNGHCQFPDAMVDRHKDFTLVAGANTYGRGADRMYVGRQQLDAATLDRFSTISWDYDEGVEYDWAGRDQTNWVRFVQDCRHVAEAHSMRVVISPRASIKGAKLLRAGIERDKVEEYVLWKGISQDDRNRINAGVRRTD